MNTIKHRLKRLESNVIDTSGCLCFARGEQVKIIQTEPMYYDARKTGEYVPYQDSADKIEADKQDAERAQTVIEDFLQCGRKVEKRIIYLRLI
jgi:hypothetical protein